MMEYLWNKQLLVQGSEEHRTIQRQYHIPVPQPIVEWHKVKDTWEYEYPESVSYCTITWDGKSTTCYVCEGGHHVHIKWEG